MSVMKYKSVTVTTNHGDAELVSQAMFDAGAEGVSVLDKQDFADLLRSDVVWDYVDESLLSASDDVKVATTVPADNACFLKVLEERLKELASYGVRYGEITVDEIDDADWANEWKKYYKPIVTPNVTVVPSWIKYTPKEHETVMRLDPGMAFGTGEHATTRMCLELMDAKGKRVIDVGCGSGILGIAAALTGATEVYMCDIDSQAVEFARRNAEFNGVDCVTEQADLLKGDRAADLIFANITADVLMRLADGIGRHLAPGGEIILSGIIAERLEEVERKYTECGYAVITRAANGDWRAMKLRRK